MSYLTDEDREALRYAVAHWVPEYDEGSRLYEVLERIVAKHVARLGVVKDDRHLKKAEAKKAED